ncbi:MAG: C10 family peptidase [Prevotella sp.]|nr:C10 family peptidase [Prevotella sp.]
MNYKFLLSMMLTGTVLAASANPITRGEARKVAQELVGISDTQSDDVPVSPIYIFSRGAGQGFVIVSGDDSTAPIIGYTEQGDYEPSAMPEQLRGMLAVWEKGLKELQQHPTTAKRRAPKARAVASYKKDWQDVPALVQTHWHQSSPYNDMAPVMDNGNHCATGCVATAGSQVAYYFHKDNPTELQYATPTYGYGTPVTESLPKGTPIEWDKMRLSGSGTTAQNKAVATLVYALGASAGLTYGESTSGHNYRAGHWNMADALKGQFHLNYAYKGKWETDQQSWETLIYNNLKSRRPMLYSGVHPDQGGHSVVLDGYQASTGLFHFNFGWGGQGDGWYTVDDNTGMNGFKESQDLVYNFTPQVQNISARLTGGKLYHKAKSRVQLKLTNDGTLDYRGLYVYLNTKPAMPSSSADALDLADNVEPGNTADLTIEVTPKVQGPVYVFLTGSSKRFLDSLQLTVEPTVADLHMSRFTVDAGTESVAQDAMTFRMVNNTTATFTAMLENGDQGTYCMPVLRAVVEAYDPETKAWTAATTVTVDDVTFEEGQRQTVDFVCKNLTEGRLYRACLDETTEASEPSAIQFDTDERYVYFTVRKADLQLSTTGRTAVVTGRWNASLFREKATSADVCSYDMTAMTDLAEQPVAPNPNALFYAAADNTDWLVYDNVVVGDVCGHLAISTHADFLPMRPFTATKASLTLQEAVAGKWKSAMIPFAAQVPYGMQMKAATELTATGLNHTFTRQIGPMSVVTYLTDRNALNTVEAEQVSITTDSSVSLFDGAVQAYTIATDLPAGAMVPGEYILMLYYQKPAAGQTVLEAFMPMLTGSTATRLTTTSERSTDSAYRTLSGNIQKAYETLEQCVAVSEEARSTFLAELKAAEDLFTYRTHETDADITARNESLKAAIAALLEAEASGIVPQTVASPTGPTEYYNLSGQRIGRPERGIVIVRQGSTARKVLVK